MLDTLDAWMHAWIHEKNRDSATSATKRATVRPRPAIDSEPASRERARAPRRRMEDGAASADYSPNRDQSPSP